MAATRSDWRGALSFAGLPIPIAFHGVVATRSSEFKSLDPKHLQPIRAPWLDRVNGEEVDRSQVVKGVEVAPDHFVAIPDSVLERMSRSNILEIERFCPEGSGDLQETLLLASKVYDVGPDPKVPGSEASIQTLWNGLRKTKSCAVLENWVARAGSRPNTVVIRATATGLVAYALPYANEVRVNELFEPELNTKAAKLMATIIEAQYETGDFDHTAYVDTYSQRREAAIETVLKGAPLPAPVLATPETSHDIIAGLEAMVAEKSKPRARKKAVA